MSKDVFRHTCKKYDYCKPKCSDCIFSVDWYEKPVSFYCRKIKRHLPIVRQDVNLASLCKHFEEAKPSAFEKAKYPLEHRMNCLEEKVEALGRLVTVQGCRINIAYGLLKRFHPDEFKQESEAENDSRRAPDDS